MDGGQLAEGPQLIPHGRAPGEPALEVEGLRHGLFTYTLLRGMGGGINREDEPSMISDLALRDNADFNGDGIITTGEARRLR